MRKGFKLVIVSTLIAVVVFGSYQDKGFILEHEQNIALQQPSPHKGLGMSTGYVFFKEAKNLAFSFRKRVLKVGSSIGYHLQKEDEVYYIVSGNGKMQMNEQFFNVKPGDAILTRTGSSHGLQQTGADSLVIIITYPVQ